MHVCGWHNGNVRSGMSGEECQERNVRRGMSEEECQNCGCQNENARTTGTDDKRPECMPECMPECKAIMKGHHERHIAKGRTPRGARSWGCSLPIIHFTAGALSLCSKCTSLCNAGRGVSGKGVSGINSYGSAENRGQ